MGNEAIALGAIRAGIRFASGYPGTPSSEILETLVKEKSDSVYAEWSVNEKSALEAAAGAAIAGARSMVTMKQVGLNVASDPLMSLTYIGIKGGMVIVVADDPGPISSQTEQDTRHFGQYAHIPVFDPSTPEDAYTMIADAFACSEEIKRPVLFRPTTRVCHSYASVDLLDAIACPAPEGFTKDNGKWVIFPKLAYTNHLKIAESQKSLEQTFSRYEKNTIIEGNDGALQRGIVSGGVSWQYVMEALHAYANYRALKIATYPLPSGTVADFLKDLDEVLVIEELDPVIEKELIFFCGANKMFCTIKIKGKLTGDMPLAGENNPALVHDAIASFLGGKSPFITDQSAVPNPALPKPALPVRPPMLCAGCPHRASFFAVKEAALQHPLRDRKAVFSGDIGCYTLGNALPLDMIDTCLCMGAGLTMAQGINRVEPQALNVAFIGDSTFFHTWIVGIINAVYNGSDIIVAILDNGTTAMTGGQPHPQTGKTLMGNDAPRIDIQALVCALNVASVQRVNAFDFNRAKQAIVKAAEQKGVRVIIFEGLCVTLMKNKTARAINPKTCTGCGLCVKKLGCPALFLSGKNARIETALCTGCDLCKAVCPANAIDDQGVNYEATCATM